LEEKMQEQEVKDADISNELDEESEEDASEDS